MYLLDISVSMQFPTLLAEKGNYQKLRFLQLDRWLLCPNSGISMFPY